MPTVLHLVRHGESEWNASRRVQGQTAHVGLTDLGRRQATEAADALEGLPITAVLTSDQRRAMQTAAIIAERVGTIPTREPRLREQSLGWLEGLPLDEAMRRSAGTDWTDPDTRPSGGESIRDVYRRLGPLLEHVRQTGGECVLVSHGDTIRVALAILEGLPPESVPHAAPANGSVTTVTIQPRVLPSRQDARGARARR
jgi:broad specificity phosphatase PhoE